MSTLPPPTVVELPAARPVVALLQSSYPQMYATLKVGCQILMFVAVQLFRWLWDASRL